MAKLTLSADTRTAPADVSDPTADGALYGRSYLLIRTMVGILGIGLPILLLVFQRFMDESITDRGSMSAYYHSPARDLFVGSLWVIGFLLIAYKAAEPRTWDFWVSLFTGIGAVVLASFPTGRPGLPHGHLPRCEVPSSLGVQCTWLQERMHEANCQWVHRISTVTLMVGIAALCVVFAVSEFRPHGRRNAFARKLYWSCLGLIGVAAVVAFLPIQLHVYLAEAIAIFAFGISWFWKGRGLWRALPPLRNQDGEEAVDPVLV